MREKKALKQIKHSINVFIFADVLSKSNLDAILKAIFLTNNTSFM